MTTNAVVPVVYGYGVLETFAPVPTRKLMTLRRPLLIGRSREKADTYAMSCEMDRLLRDRNQTMYVELAYKFGPEFPPNTHVNIEFMGIPTRDKQMSGFHALVFYDTKALCWMALSMSDKNPTYVDGVGIWKSMKPVPLRSVSILQLGETVIYWTQPKEPYIYTDNLAEYERKALAQKDRKKLMSGGSASATPVSELDDDHRDDDYDDDAALGAKRSRRQNADDDTEDNNEAGPSASRSRSRSRPKKKRAPPPVVVDPNWTQREKADFLRFLFTFGPPVVDQEDGSGTLDWSMFRNHANFAKKSDEHMDIYFDDYFSECLQVMRTGKSKRDIHDDSCDCPFCSIVRKRKQALEKTNPMTPEIEKRIKSFDEPKPHLAIGMITAQKLRVRFDIIEAAKQVDTEKGKRAMTRLSVQCDSDPMMIEMPDWWVPGEHDRLLLLGVVEHGVGRWEEIWNDPGFKSVLGDEAPLNSTLAMRRLRAIANAIISEGVKGSGRGGGSGRSNIRSGKRGSSKSQGRAGQGKGASRSRSRSKKGDDQQIYDEDENEEVEAEGVDTEDESNGDYNDEDDEDEDGGAEGDARNVHSSDTEQDDESSPSVMFESD
eukprot:CAMPEP_0184696522 /NCGR_PEP_ID=MMETSP0313-20130426/3775_1 /TAXON_ID=2792 /ORGANISM="Porphyridium aerugineum, Strain SAG 1380-2" /LENGTH=600 /DNA_ID=CAMNT_0027155153 /DNA_START=73 /DNA_END=1875 /DNA_ORIENTATION=+